MSLHPDDSSDSSGFSFLFLLPWWIFVLHFNGKTSQQVVAFDCDQAGACELCAE